MKAIYEPKGAALEYAPLACNLFRGCNHGCTYCYCPGVLRMDRAEFHRQVYQRPGILEALDRDAEALDRAGDTRRIHLCFTCDPFGMHPFHGFTRLALSILRSHNRPVAILTKGNLCPEDLDALAKMDALVGLSLVWGSDAVRAQWEPNTATVGDRADNLQDARARGLRTFISVEPVIDPEEALWAIGVGMAVADEIRVGKLNHAEPPAPVDWPQFARVVRDMLTKWAAEKPGRSWMLKRGLAELVVAP
jgi:DNA repair photolyase